MSSVFRMATDSVPSGDPFLTAGSPTIPVNTYNAVDSRTGSSIDDDPREPIGHVNKNTDFRIWIKTQVNPFDPSLRPPRILASLRDGEGCSRTVFHVGETASFYVDQGTDSVPVTALRLKGDRGLDQTLNSVALPKDIPVTFDKPGLWKAAITGWSAASVQADIAVEVLVTPYADLGPSFPGQAPYLVSYEPQPDTKRGPQNKVSPSVLLPGDPIKDRWWWRFLNPKVVTGELGCRYKVE